MKKAFVVSTGRTGTSFLFSFLEEHVSNVVARAEEKPAFKRRGLELVSRESHLTERLYFKITRDWRMFGTGADWFVEVNNRLFSTVDKVIRRVYPDARVFQIIRDGRNVVSSWLNRGRYFPNEHPSRLTPEGIDSTIPLDVWNSWNALQKITWNWKTNNQVIDKSSPDKLFYFETMFQSPYDEMFRLMDNLEGINYSKQDLKKELSTKVNSTRVKHFPSYPEWTDGWKKQFWEIAESTMHKYGYTRDNYGQLPNHAAGERA